MSMSKKILVFQHAASEGLGLFEEELKKAGFAWETLMISGDTIFPSGVKLEEYGALIVLGGPMGVYQEAKYPWIAKELMLIQEALRQKKPILGICLGAQLLAKAAGARVYKGPVPEIGWRSVRLDDWFYKRNPLFFQIDPAKEHIVFQWHGDTFDIPTEGYRLAWNEAYANQAFCFNGNAVGLQFHPEMTEAMIAEWIASPGAPEQLAAAGEDAEKILANVPKYMPALRDIAHKIIYGFVSLIRENRRNAA
jgi:GMP synthase (glutamine-hydrolysing)